MILTPMAQDGVEPMGSMGNDAALAVLSDKPKLLYDYFKQLFAQVTNPPIDAIREELVMSTEVMVGAESNILEPSPLSCHQIRLDYPLLTNPDLAKIRHRKIPGFAVVTIPILFQPGSGGAGTRAGDGGLQRRLTQPSRAANLIISRIAAWIKTMPPSRFWRLRHHPPDRRGTRTQVGLLLESGGRADTPLCHAHRLRATAMAVHGV
jgi:glutamate synthase (ferredoxin)